MNDLISRQAAIDALWKALYEYEDKAEKQFQESDELNVGDWILHRVFVQNMSDIDRQTILDLPAIDPVKHGKWEKISDRNYKCMCCNAWWSVDRDSTMKDFKHCPSCGAQMEMIEE